MQLRKGMRISCEISGHKVPRAYVQEENGKIFICQDVMNGNSCKNKMGFKYSWDVGSGNDKDLENFSVRDIYILTSDIENIIVGDIIENATGKFKVLGNAHDVWFISYKDFYDRVSTFRTLTELKMLEYKIVLPESPQESDDVTITVEGKSKTISRRSAKELGLI